MTAKNSDPLKKIPLELTPLLQAYEEALKEYSDYIKHHFEPPTKALNDLKDSNDSPKEFKPKP